MAQRSRLGRRTVKVFEQEHDRRASAEKGGCVALSRSIRSSVDPITSDEALAKPRRGEGEGNCRHRWRKVRTRRDPLARRPPQQVAEASAGREDSLAPYCSTQWPGRGGEGEPTRLLEEIGG